jgi:hypothetical protein
VPRHAFIGFQSTAFPATMQIPEDCFELFGVWVVSPNYQLPVRPAALQPRGEKKGFAGTQPRHAPDNHTYAPSPRSAAAAARRCVPPPGAGQREECAVWPLRRGLGRRGRAASPGHEAARLPGHGKNTRPACLSLAQGGSGRKGLPADHDSLDACVSGPGAPCLVSGRAQALF